VPDLRVMDEHNSSGNGGAIGGGVAAAVLVVLVGAAGILLWRSRARRMLSAKADDTVKVQSATCVSSQALISRVALFAEFIVCLSTAPPHPTC
jgi:hypothetical protein